MLIERFDAFFFDLDGVIYLAGQPLPGAVEVLRALAQRGKPVRFLTNDPRPDRNAIVRRLQAMGLPIGADQVFNVGYVTALWLRRRLGQGAPVHVVGSDG
ncbi:MAG TPA: HAD family hydrolase, partial [Bacillota bacterium]